MFIRICCAIFALFIFAGCAQESDELPAPPYDVYVSTVGLEPEEIESAIAGIQKWTEASASRGVESVHFKGLRSDAYTGAAANNGAITIYLGTREMVAKRVKDANPAITLGFAQRGGDVFLIMENFPWRHSTFVGPTPEETKRVTDIEHQGHLDKVTSTVLHELGHVLGIADHSQNSADVMYHQTTDITNLTDHDLDMFCKTNGC